MRWILLLVAALGSVGAWAYIPPSGYMVSKLAQRRTGFRTLRITSQVIAFKDGQPAGADFQETLTYDTGAEVLISEASSSGKPLYRLRRSLQESNASASPLGDFLLFSSKASTVEASLRSKGIPVVNDKEETLFMRRWKEAVAWIIGNPADASPSLWIEKDSFLPLVLKWSAPGKSEPLELEFEGFSFYNGYQYPRKIRLSSEGKVVLEADLKTIDLNVKLDPLPAGTTLGVAEAGEQLDDDGKTLLQTYYQFVR